MVDRVIMSQINAPGTDLDDDSYYDYFYDQIEEYDNFRAQFTDGSTIELIDCDDPVVSKKGTMADEIKIQIVDEELDNEKAETLIRESNNLKRIL